MSSKVMELKAQETSESVSMITHHQVATEWPVALSYVLHSSLGFACL